jgi:signal transduction histidine kinase
VRWTVARLALAVTSMVAIAFLIPLALMAREIARERAIADAHQQAAGVVAVLTVSAERDIVSRAVAATDAGAAGHVAVYLPDQQAVGTPRAAPNDVGLVRERRQSITAPLPHGVAYLQPVALDGGRTAVIEVYVPDSELSRGVVPAWLAIAGLAVLLVGGSTLVADRLGARLVAAARGLARTSRAFGAGELGARVEPTGPPELVEAGTAFNTMADRVIAFMDTERELAADLSHRLRTPLAALQLDAERLPATEVGDRVRDAVRALEDEIDAIIRSARQPTVDRAQDSTDLVEVLADRLAFWAVLAEDHQRPWRVRGAERPVWVPVPRADLVSAIDALLGNVFEHTPQGTAFQIAVSERHLVVEDAGPGIFDVTTALRRGSSGSGSTGLGLSIVRRVAGNAGGAVHVDRGELGGARITLSLPGISG